MLKKNYTKKEEGEFGSMKKNAIISWKKNPRPYFQYFRKNNQASYSLAHQTIKLKYLCDFSNYSLIKNSINL